MIRADPLTTGASAISTAVASMGAIANNLANLRTSRPPRGEAFRGSHVIAEATPAGVRIGAIVPAGTAEGVLLPEPTDPSADARGMVRYPDIDVGAELVGLITAQRTVEANVVSVRQAVDTYRELLAMTNSDRSRLAASGG